MRLLRTTRIASPWVESIGVTTTTNDAPAYATSGSMYFSLMLAVLAAVVILSGIGASKAVVLGPIITDGGFFLFPLAYIIGDVITEIYGTRAARIAIITGMIVNVMSALAYGIIIALPGFNDAYGQAKQAAIVGALGPVWIVVVAGMLGFLGGQTANSVIMYLGKRKNRERGLIARLASSTGIGELIDTVIFCTVASYAIGITSFTQWANYAIFGFLYKVAVQYAVMPLTALAIRAIKKREPSYQEALANQAT